MSKSTKTFVNSHTSQRRDFLRLALMASGALAAGSALSGAQAMEVDREPEPTESQQRGYHVTPHIIDYYNRARF